MHNLNRALYLVELVKEYNISIEAVAEIGVWKGHTSRILLKHLPSIKVYHLVDCWKDYEEYDTSQFSAPPELSESKAICEATLRLYADKLVWHHAFSVEAVKEFDNASLDLVFIDANHAYEHVLQDINNWAPKVRSGGILAGHDYQLKFPGVCKAVDELLGNFFHIGPDSVWWVRYA